MLLDASPEINKKVHDCLPANLARRLAKVDEKMVVR